MHTSNLNSIDLFCGAGGLSEGFKWAGFQSLVGIDFWEPAVKSFSENHKPAIGLTRDVAEITYDKIKEITNLNNNRINILSGGPPCQGFSSAGRKILDDPRNFLFKHFLRLANEIKPDWIILENVPNLIKHSEVFNEIKEWFQGKEIEEKYIMDWKLANSVHYGAPQNRTRVLIVAKRESLKTKEPFSLDKGLKQIFSESLELFSSGLYTTASEALSDLPDVESGQGFDAMPYTKPAQTSYQKFMRGEIGIVDFLRDKGFEFYGENFIPYNKSNVIDNHIAADHSEILVKRFSIIPEGGTKEDIRRINPSLLPPEGHAAQGLTYGRLWSEKPSGTIPANYGTPSGNRSIHYNKNRIITVREACRLFGFPDYYRILGNRVDQQHQVGNAVSPILAYVLGSYLKRISYE